MLVGHLLEALYRAVIGVKWDMMDLIGRAIEQATIQLAVNTWLRKGGEEKFLLRVTW
jgi:hypothetical protein